MTARVFKGVGVEADGTLTPTAAGAHAEGVRAMRGRSASGRLRGCEAERLHLAFLQNGLESREPPADVELPPGS